MATIDFGFGGDDIEPRRAPSVSDGTPFYVRNEDGGLERNPDTIETYSRVTGPDGNTYYAVHEPVFSSGKAPNETPVTTYLSEGQYRNLAGDGSFSSVFKDIATSPIGQFAAMALFPGLGANIGAALAGSSAAAPIIGNALVKGALAEATGGDFLKGAVLSGAGSLVPGINSSISDALGGGSVADIAAGSLTGGALSSLAGGDFTQGALMGGAGAGIKGLEQDLRQEQFDTAMTESGLAGQTATSPSDFLQDTSEPLTISEIINNLQPFQPDYSLGNTENAAVVDGFGLKPDLSAPIGDPNSFINQPPPQINYTLPEFTDLPPVDSSAELTSLGIAKTLLPAAIAAIVANNATPEADTSTGFGIVPIPGDWRSPEYNQQFTPSAPVDFGSRELLRGTQFENPAFQPQTNYSLSDVINSMNYQSAPFVQQYQIPMQTTVGNNDIIGSLNGNQVSIADIIAGIQSQYGQKTSS